MPIAHLQCHNTVALIPLVALFFLPLSPNNRAPIFANSQAIVYLRSSLARMRSEMPFEITAAVILPDHIHFLWSLPSDDSRLVAE